MQQGNKQTLARTCLIRQIVHLMCLLASLMLPYRSVGAELNPGISQANTPVSRTYRHVEVVDGVVTVEVRNVKLRELLADIAHQTGLQLVLHAPLEQRVSLTVQQLSLPEAMQRILHDHSYALRYIQQPARAEMPNNNQRSSLWIFSGEATADVKEIDMPDDEVITLLRLDLAGNNAKVRLQTVSSLAELGGDQATTALTSALADPDALVRQEAIDALGEIGNITTVPTLKLALLDPDTAVREAAIAAFVNLGGDQAALALAVTLNDEDSSLREKTVDALGEIGGETATRLLQRALVDQERYIREAAAENLAELSNQ